MVHTANNNTGEGTDAVEAGQVDLINSRAQIDTLVARISEALVRFEYPEPSRFAVRLAVEEGISNAFRHGHRGLKPDVPVNVAYQIAADDLTIRITDRGPGFDPSAIPDPTLDENLERPGGRGIMLMRAYMTRVDFERPGNRILLHYRRPACR